MCRKNPHWNQKQGKNFVIFDENIFNFQTSFSPASITARLQSESNQTKRAISLYTNQTTASYQNNLPNYTFQIQLLIEPDRHVLQSIEKSLTDFSHPSALLHSCQFFNAVLINDFPPEIFLQRPRIVMVSL